MATPFPPDIELEIFLKLPSKSLHRFKCVSKSWYSLITNPNFVSKYHRRTSLNPHLLLLHHPLRFSLTPDCVLSISDVGVDLIPPFDPPLTTGRVPPFSDVGPVPITPSETPLRTDRISTFSDVDPTLITPLLTADRISPFSDAGPTPITPFEIQLNTDCILSFSDVAPPLIKPFDTPLTTDRISPFPDAGPTPITPFDPPLTRPVHSSLNPEPIWSFPDVGPSLIPPFETPYIKRVEFLNSEAVNGVVAVVVYSASGPGLGPETGCELYLWNVFTGESVKTPVSDVTGLFDGVPNVVFYGGFGFDDVGDDYKVVRVVYMDSVKIVTELYSIKENCWRGVNSQSSISSNTLWASSKCTFLGGVGHWGAYKKEKGKFFVLGFDFRSELFKKTSLPSQCIDGDEMRYHSLWVYKGLLAISVLHFGDFESRVSKHYIWVRMANEDLSCWSDSYKWVKLFNIDLEGGPRRPICSLSSGELLLCGESDGDYVVYDKQLELCKSVEMFGVDVVIPCVESLVSLNKLLPRT